MKIENGYEKFPILPTLLWIHYHTCILHGKMAFGRVIAQKIWSAACNRLIDGDKTIYQDINDILEELKV